MRLTDADNVEKEMCGRLKELRMEYGEYDHYTNGFEDAIGYVELSPTIDAVPVVRCKDCKMGEPSNVWGGWWFCISNNIHHGGDNFCSYGERRCEND